MSAQVETLTSPEPDLPTLDSWVPVALVDHEEPRSAALRFIWESNQEPCAFRTTFRNIQLIELLGEIQETDVTEYLLQEADPMKSNFNVVGRRRAAIRALAKHDRAAAFEAATSAMSQDPHDRQYFPAVLIGIDSERAIPLLCRQLVDEVDRLMRRALKVALRQSGSPGRAETEVTAMLQGSADERFAAAQILGWMESEFLPDELVKNCNSERIEWVRLAFLSAAASRALRLQARQLIEEFAESSGIDQWRFIDAIYDSVPPECLGRKADPLWIGPIYEQLPPTLRNYSDERHLREMKQLEKDL